MTQVYSIPSRESDPHSLPDVEVFHNSHFGYTWDDGWYYWYCLPGCLPDGDPIGPFDSEEKAIEDAQSESEEELDSD